MTFPSIQVSLSTILNKMRITGGQCVGPPGLQTRPTASKIRQAFFNILGRKFPGARFLDLFAGTGLMGLEALSRGASSLIAVEENRNMVRAIEGNLKQLHLEAEVICGDVRRVLPVLEPEAFDIIFADPPYKTSLAQSAVQGVRDHGLLAPDGILAVEHARGADLLDQVGQLEKFDCRQYGQTAVSFYRLRH
jgi:16S rRNA (guanine966-N2)-methyltransferase